MKFSLNWVYSAGGPLIVIPAELASYWRGVEGWVPPEELGKDIDDFPSDYTRACEIEGYLGMLDVGLGKALILGDEPMQTAYLPKPEGGVLIRWMYAETESVVRRLVESIPESVWEVTPYSIDVAENGVLVFDSALPGNVFSPRVSGLFEASWMQVELLPGTYLVDTADYHPDGSTRLVLHRFRLSM